MKEHTESPRLPDGLVASAVSGSKTDHREVGKDTSDAAGSVIGSPRGKAAGSWDHEPTVMVGIVSGEQICFSLNSLYTAKGLEVQGEQRVTYDEGAILWNGNQYRELIFHPLRDDASFSLHDVTIGVNFHWERKETQTFLGTLRLVVEADKICAINEIAVERYLESVVSSEMSATSSLELLKAHAVISRSWLLAQMEKRRTAQAAGTGFFSFNRSDDELIRWYDREDHTVFDVCADDHCQRYQGITKGGNPHVAEAIRETRGRILMMDDSICDARFSKCCGGMTEEFQYCWENIRKPYLTAVRDLSREGERMKDEGMKDERMKDERMKDEGMKDERMEDERMKDEGMRGGLAATHDLPDLTIEANAERWIRTAPDAFCNTHDANVLRQVLNDYDQETADFYRWTVEYTQQEVGSLLAEKLKIDFGPIIDLVPADRGRSGRISKLRIVGGKRTFTIGKELEIRRALSPSHLYSSAFVVDRMDVRDGVPQRFRLTGAGWGHGVGLCQIGAAVMGEQGYGYDRILLHYYRGAEISRLYP